MKQAFHDCHQLTATVPLLGAALLLTTACGAEQSAGSDEGSEDPLQVFAAASLAESFSELGETFEETHGEEVVFNFAGSSDLVAQIEQGAPAGVFASADEPTMERAQQSEALAAGPELFAANTLVIITPPDNPAGIRTFGDLAGDHVITVVCAPQVPCGTATAQAADAVKAELTPASEENAVTDVLGKVRSGEADAGVVYRTDALSAGNDVETIEFEGAEDVVNHYPIATLQEADRAELAQEFVDFVLGPESQQVLSDAGFASP